MVISHVFCLLIISYASFAYGDSEEFAEETKIVKNNSANLIEDDDLEYKPSTETPPCNGDPNAISNDCGDNNCGRLCSNYDKGIACIQLCQPGCHCKPKYVFDENIQKCVLPSQCTPVCKKDEVYNGCTNTGCVPLNCTELGFPIPCKRIDPRYCIKGCVCAGDKLRAKNGTCVPRQQCDSPCGGDKNSVPGCGNNCGRLCSNRKNNVTIVCILECKLNGSPCGGDPNAISGCGVNCGRYCSDLNNEYTVACKKICNLNGCDCKEGYWYDDVKGKCVPPEQCPPVCGVNEEYNPCVIGLCRAQNCTQKGNSIPCPDVIPGSCKGGCVCKENYLKLVNGTCVPENECDVKGCKENEEYSECTNGGCDARNCTQLGKPVPCVKLDPKDCIKGCVCKKGYLRNSNGLCVPTDKCDKPLVCGKNEVITGCVNGGCYKRKCNQPILCIDPIPGGCIRGCRCKPDYVRDDNGKCIRECQCPVIPHCKPNEVYNNCTNTGCEPRSCDDLGNALNCQLFDEDSKCVGGCVCQPGYLYNKKGVCVPREKCDSCGGDSNATPGCGGYCGQLCSNFNSSDPIVCPLICNNINGCDCRTGFYLSELTGKCVPPEECQNTTPRPPVCGVNEEYNPCVIGLCRAQECTEKGNSILCPDVIPGSCKGGCVCKENYLKSSNGTCIPENDCDG